MLIPSNNLEHFQILVFNIYEPSMPYQNHLMKPNALPRSSVRMPAHLKTLV